MKDYLEKMAVARAIVKKRTPYISTTLLALVPHEVPGMFAARGYGIATTEKLVLLVDPDWFMEISDEEAAAALFHETQHPIRGHFSRSNEFPDKTRFNKAGDLGINVDAREAGFTLPKGSLFPALYGFPEGLSAEEYYNLFPDEPEGPGEGEEGATPPPAGGACAGQCGGAAGNPGEGEEEYEKEVEAESPGATKSEAAISAIMKQQAREIQNHVDAHGRGSVPAHLVEWAKFALKPPKVKWRQALPRILRRALGRIRAGGEDFSRKRPSKRSFVRGTLIPGLISRETEIAFIRDTSGSMQDAQLEEAQNEMIGAFKAAGVASVWFMDCDAQVAKPKRVSVRDIPKLPITGRGGTDFGPALEVIKKLKPRPKLVLYFTDGDGYAPPKPPLGIDVIWVVVNSYWNRRPAPWGHCVFVGEPKDADDY